MNQGTQSLFHTDKRHRASLIGKDSQKNTGTGTCFTQDNENRN